MIPFVGIDVPPMPITGHSTEKPFAGWVQGRMGQCVFGAKAWWSGDFFLA